MNFRPPDLRHLELPILHADEAIVVVDKLPDLLAVPGRLEDAQDCVASRVARRFPDATGPLMPHRLDMATSGVMVVGRTPEAHRSLSIQFQERTIGKRYIAVLDGEVEGDQGEVRLPFRVDWPNRPRQVYDPVHGKLGETGFEVLERTGGRTRIAFRPLTGRTHQLRVHAAHSLGLGCPIVGDRLYGDPRLSERLLLHAEALEFTHPSSGERVLFEVMVPF
jgi:tRNA pseudouridine32 synthase/23S rRNA pseudouridine746 synthase